MKDVFDRGFFAIISIGLFAVVCIGISVEYELRAKLKTAENGAAAYAKDTASAIELYRKSESEQVAMQDKLDRLQHQVSVGETVRVSDVPEPQTLTEETAIRLAAVQSEYQETLSQAVAMDNQIREKSKELAILIKLRKQTDHHLGTLRKAIDLLTVEESPADPPVSDANYDGQAEHAE